MLEARYEARVAYGRQHPELAPIWPQEDFVAHHVGNREALHRSRAALALGRLGVGQAEKALRAALAEKQRPDVKDAIRQALEEMQAGSSG